MMKRGHIVAILGFSLLNALCSASRNGSQTGNKKRFYIQPVYLSVTGIERDSSIWTKLTEAFATYKVQLITEEEMKTRVADEVRRVQQQLLSKTDEFKGKGAKVIFKAVSEETKYVSNMVALQLGLHGKDDLLEISKASWSSMPVPLNLNQPSGVKQRTIDLSGHSSSVRETIRSIVDSILYSGELK